MLHKNMQSIKTAQTAIAGSYDPAQQESAILRTGFYVTAACILVAAFILLLA